MKDGKIKTNYFNNQDTSISLKGERNHMAKHKKIERKREIDRRRKRRKERLRARAKEQRTGVGAQKPK